MPHVIGLTTSTADRKRRAGQRMILGIAGTALTGDERALIRELQPAGFVLFARNVAEPEQVLELNRELVSLCPVATPPLRCVDQEGGRVQRIKALAPHWPPMRWVGNVGDLAYSRAVGAAMAQELLALGFDLDFAPDADVDSNPKNPVIGDRSFGRDPKAAARHVVAYLDGMQGAGLAACAKHFPGHGDTSVDSHKELPIVEKDPPDLDACELVPFVAAVRAGVASVMSAHVVYPAWDEDRPATMSARIIPQQLRQRMGFGGLVFSDDMEMKALYGRYPLEEQLRRATEATVDVFLFCSLPELQVQAFEALVRLQEEGKAQDDAAVDAGNRVEAVRRRFLLGRQPAPDLSILRDPGHHALALRGRVEGQS